MGRGDRRHKQPPRGIPELAPIRPLRAQARDKKGQSAPTPEDPRLVALGARCDRYGLGRGRDSRRLVSAPHMGEDLGRVLERLCGSREEVDRLWAVWVAYAAAMRTYRVRILDRTGEPKGPSVVMVAEKIEAEPDAVADIRTEAEKDEGARESWRRWRDRLDRLFAADRVHLVQAESGTGRSLWEGKTPTPTGRVVLTALRRLADVVEGER